MKLNILMKTARSAVVEIENGDIYQSKQTYKLYVNNKLYGETDKVINGIYDLKPDKEYSITVEGVDNLTKNDSKKSEVTMSAPLIFRTDYEFVTLNVKDFGAKGDGVSNDTPFIQAAIMSCPSQSRILIPKGTYKITSLFLKSNIQIELEKGAVLSAYTDRAMFPVLKGLYESYDEEKEYNLGTWEGNPLDTFASIITGIEVENVVIYGQGVIDGNASVENWWNNPKIRRIAWRPRQIFLNNCKNVIVEGITVQNSPSWNIHPYFSQDLKFINMSILNPKISPNTDGLDPESCKNVEIVGIYFSLGDDCIAVKSGKIYMGAKYKTPSENITINQCCMRDGHGSITIGSEMAGGVKNLVVKNCRFIETDRGLRIKTRRGRGEQAVIDKVMFENIIMDNVMTPFVVNSFYFCDPDGYTEYVRSKEALPVDERTPNIKSLVFKNIVCKNCHVAAAFIYGLPEQKIKKVEMRNISVTYSDNPKKDVPAMMEDVMPCCKKGVIVNNVEELVIDNVTVEGQDGAPFVMENIDHLVRR